MAMLIKEECRCCQKMMKSGDMWHCETCWNNHHNGMKDNDFLPEKEFREFSPNNGYMKTLSRESGSPKLKGLGMKSDKGNLGPRGVDIENEPSAPKGGRE